jgi:hypothetical protein
VFQRDYLLRIIQQAAEAVARALKLLRERKSDEAEQALGEGYAALGIDRELLLVLDAPTLRSQLADDEKVAIAVRLLLADAEVRRAQGQPKAAVRRLRSAARLAEQLREPDPELTAELEHATARFGTDLD